MASAKVQRQIQIRFDHVLVPQSAGLRRHVQSMHALCCACNITLFFFISSPDVTGHFGFLGTLGRISSNRAVMLYMV